MFFITQRSAKLKKWNFLTTIQPDARHVGDCEKGENEIKFNEGKVYVEIQ